MRTLALASLMALLLPVWRCGNGQEGNSTSVVLVANGDAKATIVIAEQAAGCVPVAARELRDHIERMSGARLPIAAVADKAATPLQEITAGKAAIMLGESAYTRQLGLTTAQCTADGFLIETGPARLVIMGRDDEKFGLNFRWAPASAGTLYGVYRLLEHLGVRWFYPTELGTVIPRRRDIALGPLRIEDAPYFAYRHTGYGDDKSFAWHRRIGAGGDRDVWATRHTYEALGFHKKYGQSSPEYFCVNRDGQRGQAVALGHPGVVDATIREARAYFQSALPKGRKYFIVIPADGRGCCQCTRCQSRLDPTRGPDGDMSNYVADAAVKVAHGLRAEFPRYPVVYCAYSRYRLAPSNVETLPENMVVLIAQKRGSFYRDNDRRDAYDLVRAWQRLKPAAIYFCRYYNSLLKMTPSLMPKLISDDIKALKALSERSDVKLRGEMNFCGVPADSQYSWWHHLNEYVTTKLLWNPDTDVDGLLDDYYERFYGPAGAAMRGLFSRCEQLYYDDAQRYVYTVDTIDQLEALLRDGSREAQGTAYAQRVAFVSKGFEPLRGMRRKLMSARQLRRPADSREGLVLYMPFDEGTGMVARDVAGGTEGRIQGGRWTAGRYGTALDLSGEQSCVRIRPVSLADTDYSIEAWVQPDAPCFTGSHFIVGPRAWNRHSLKIEQGRLWLWHRTPDRPSNHQLASPPYDFAPGVWRHVAGTFSKHNGMTVYIDGNLVALDTNKTQASRYPVALIGASGEASTKDPDDLTGCFRGAIDEVRVYTRELSYREVQDHYRGQPERGGLKQKAR